MLFRSHVLDDVALEDMRDIVQFRVVSQSDNGQRPAVAIAASQIFTIRRNIHQAI